MNFCVTDGLSVLCTRYVSSLHDEAASLYFSSGTSFYERSKGMYRMRKEDRRQNIVVVASEPLTFEKADWMEVPTNTMIIITPKMNVLQIPILDEYSPIDRPHPAKRMPSAANGVARVSSGGVGDKSRLPVAVKSSTARTPVRAAGFNIDPATRSRLISLQEQQDNGEGASAAATKHRSPDFAISAGFPPNGHVGTVGSNGIVQAQEGAA